MQRLGIRVKAMLDCVFHNRLQGQRRQTEIGERGIVIHNKHIVILSLFYCQVGEGMLQLCREGNGAVAGYGIEILTQVVSKIQRDLPGFLRIPVVRCGLICSTMTLAR